jgi:hypothetical protein
VAEVQELVEKVRLGGVVVEGGELLRRAEDFEERERVVHEQIRKAEDPVIREQVLEKERELEKEGRKQKSAFEGNERST